MLRPYSQRAMHWRRTYEMDIEHTTYCMALLRTPLDGARKRFLYGLTNGKGRNNR